MKVFKKSVRWRARRKTLWKSKIKREGGEAQERGGETQTRGSLYYQTPKMFLNRNKFGRVRFPI